ncbi:MULTISPECIES: ECF transporter S component [Sutcliffiella]|uniref:ECF transporter S component n=1 Tax=Sutcliffiella cohnii TaxID=33932 RepID=A0A223KS26_9BACI|nr:MULTISPECIES: ECF transporter S component [Sutcliffiella]AST92290.1 ECF transporter S component [Sutcliffiella cohnii]WBL13521.1 ECF transporter S component [Sutcliffiella sp. NC1]
MSTRKIALLGLLIALCVVGRMVFSSVPNVQPVTAIIIICCLLMGPQNGIILAAGTAFVSNLFLGSGTWTLLQIIAWSIIGVLSGLIGMKFKKLPIWLLATYAGFCGMLFGLIMSLERLIIGKLFWPYYLAGLPFDFNHAIGNIVFFIVLYPILSPIIKREASFMVQSYNKQ